MQDDTTNQGGTGGGYNNPSTPTDGGMGDQSGQNPTAGDQTPTVGGDVPATDPTTPPVNMPDTTPAPQAPTYGGGQSVPAADSGTGGDQPVDGGMPAEPTPAGEGLPTDDAGNGQQAA